MSHSHSFWFRRSGMGPKIYISNNSEELLRLPVWGPLWDSFLQFIPKKTWYYKKMQDVVHNEILLISDSLKHLSYWKGTETPPLKSEVYWKCGGRKESCVILPYGLSFCQNRMGWIPRNLTAYYLKIGSQGLLPMGSVGCLSVFHLVRELHAKFYRLKADLIWMLR